MVNTNNPKLFFVQALLDFLNLKKPLTKIKIATLGGEGLEARSWQSRGVLKDNGILIEKNRQLSKKLIAGTPYPVLNKLEYLDKFMESVYTPTECYLDAIHLDFCGTIETQGKMLDTLLNILKGSQVKCLAITVADERKNPTLQNWSSIESDIVGTLTYTVYNKVFNSILKDQKLVCKTDHIATRSTKRELGVLWQIVRGCRKSNMIPCEVRRYSYVSLTGSRMRSYIIFLVEDKSKLEDYIETFTYNWIQNPILLINQIQADITNEEIITEMTEQPEKQQTTTIAVTENRFPALSALIPLVSTEAQQEFTALLAQNAQFSAKLEIVEKELANIALYKESHDRLQTIISVATGKIINVTPATNTGDNPALRALENENKLEEKVDNNKDVKETSAKVVTKSNGNGNGNGNGKLSLTQKLLGLGVSNEHAIFLGLLEFEVKDNKELLQEEKIKVAKYLGFDLDKASDRQKFGAKLARRRGKFFTYCFKTVGQDIGEERFSQFAKIITPFIQKSWNEKVTSKEVKGWLTN